MNLQRLLECSLALEDEIERANLALKMGKKAFIIFNNDTVYSVREITADMRYKVTTYTSFYACNDDVWRDVLLQLEVYRNFRWSDSCLLRRRMRNSGRKTYHIFGMYVENMREIATCIAETETEAKKVFIEAGLVKDPDYRVAMQFGSEHSNVVRNEYGVLVHH